MEILNVAELLEVINELIEKDEIQLTSKVIIETSESGQSEYVKVIKGNDFYSNEVLIIKDYY